MLHQKDFDLKEVLHVFCKYFEALYLSLKQNNLDKISQTYFKQLFKFDEWAVYQSKEQKFRAKIIKVEESGLLVLATEQNEVLKFNFKEVRLIG
ncbi:MAG: hypothetical protein ACHQII_01420 [Bacteroidia bacterium]